MVNLEDPKNYRPIDFTFTIIFKISEKLMHAHSFKISFFQKNNIINKSQYRLVWYPNSVHTL